MISTAQAIILGIIEGITEFLPISSTAHLILASHVLNIVQSDFQKSFEIIIQCGAILAVVVLYWRSFLSVEVLKKVIVAFIPTGVIGLLLYKVVKTFLLGNTTVVLGSLFLGGIFLILFERYHREPTSHNEKLADEIAKISYAQCLIIGCFQAIAIVPGVSRSAATIVGGLLLGIRRKTIVEFSFLLAVPTMLAATGLDFVKNYHTIFSGGFGLLLLGFLIAFIVALVSIRWLLQYVSRHNFTFFGWYRILIAAVFFFIR